MKIKELRELTNLTQKEFAKRYHIPKRTLENWEGGQRSPSETILYLLERAVKEDYKMMKIEKRKESDHITFDRVYDNKTFHHTGYEVLIDGKWWWEMQAEDGEIAYF